jgi:pilus assembly protein CpaB
MKLARIAVLGVALAAGGGAALMMQGSPPAPEPAAPPPAPAFEVLVAAADLPMGNSLKPADLRWQPWPESAPASGLIGRSDHPGILEELAGSVVRSPILAGEPVRREKLIKGHGGFMSAILPAGRRAVAITIDNRGASSAGGFILPNDRVDVIRTIKPENGPPVSETILGNVRVLAIGQTIQERNGEKVVTGETATLELSPTQSEEVILAQKIGQLSLVLRSLADVNETGTPKRQERGAALQVIRYGVEQQAPAP